MLELSRLARYARRKPEAVRLEQQHGIHASDDWLAGKTGAHRTTVARWRRTQRLPRSVALLIRLMRFGELELVHPDWRGWTLDPRSGTLYTPAGEPLKPQDLLAIHYRRAQVDTLERELAELRTVKRAPNLAHRALELVDTFMRARGFAVHKRHARAQRRVDHTDAERAAGKP